VDLMAAQGAFGTDFYDRSILRPKHRAYYRSGRPVCNRTVPLCVFGGFVFVLKKEELLTVLERIYFLLNYEFIMNLLYYYTVIKIGPKGALGSHEIRPIHSAPSLGQSINSRNYDIMIQRLLLLK